MSIYKQYIKEIQDRKVEGLNPKPIDDGKLLSEIIKQIKDVDHIDREDSIKFFIYNVIPGTTSAAVVKSKFLKDIILRNYSLEEISPTFAFELLSHMKGGPSIEVLIDLALGSDPLNAKEAANVLKNQVFLYETDMERLEEAYKNGNTVAREIIVSYSNAEFFTKLPDIDEEIKVVTYVAGVGDISTDFLSPGSDAHSRSDRELHGKSMFEHNTEQQNEVLDLQESR